MKYKDYYATLGVPRDATLEQVKKAYRKLARQYHPDLSKDADAEAKFKELAEAYVTLKDAEKRSAYDNIGKHVPGEEFQPPPAWERPGGGNGPTFADMDLADLLAAMGHGRAGRQSDRGPVPGRDFDTTARISLEQAHQGAKLTLELDDGGAGRALEVTIPAGVRDGQKLRLRGQGGKGHQGGPNGDIYLHIAQAPHPLFQVQQQDLYFHLALSPWEAALGAQVEIPTLGNPMLLTVPAATRHARKLRVRGQGLSNGHGGRGDFYAVVHLDIPKTLSARERELFQELAGASDFNPREATTLEHANGPTST